jgi:uncharacterized protein with PIN domain
MRFVCDVMLGKMAKHLRLLGFDTVYARNDAALEHYLSSDRDRVLLTRRRRTETSSPVIQIKSEIAREQLTEIGGLIKSAIQRTAVLNRCIECNVTLTEVEKSEIEPLVPEFIYHNCARFKMCPSCRKVYWTGSHTKGMEELIKEILA